MSDKVLEILEYGSEGYLVDFKQEQYLLGKNHKKHEFLKDITAFANHPKGEDKFIIIGVVEKNGMADSFINISNLTDQAKYQQYLNDNIEPHINFEYRPIKYKEFNLAYFRIFDNKERPYLFKKNIEVIKKENQDKKNKETTNLYRIGDGYVKTGTGTRKMVRSDFERIYKNRYSETDRKTDLMISPNLIDLEDFPLDNEISVKFLDLNIENTSNASIDFDIEMKVFKSNFYKIITNTEFEQIKKEQSSTYSFGGNVVLPNFHVDYEEEEKCFIFKRAKLRNMKTAISIAQLYTEKEVFGKEILIIFNESCNVAVEVTIRSDDFNEGALIQRFDVKI